VSYPDRTAFIISNPQLVAEVMKRKPAKFRIFLVGGNHVRHAHITSCHGLSFHDTAIRICRGMLQYGLIHIVSDESSRQLEQKVTELIGDSMRFATSGAIENALENLWANLSFLPGSLSIDSARGMFEDRPAILIASGPSLQKNVHLLNSLKNKAVLISCGSTLGALRRRDITPHFEVVVDPGAAMHEVLKPHLDSPACFVLSLMAPFMISQECSGKRMYFQVNFGPRVTEDLERLTGIHTVLPAMASVSTTALFFALHIGCNPIIFVGLDLCYTEGRTHIDRDGIPQEECTVETANGRVQSSSALKEAFDFFAGFIPTVENRKIINATEGGAIINGAEHISLSEAAARHLTRTITFPELSMLDLSGSPWKPRLKELRNGFNGMHVKAAGFHRKIREHLDESPGGSGTEEKIIRWFDSLRSMAGYEYLAGSLDWACYKANATAGLDSKLELLAATEKMLLQQIRVIEKELDRSKVK
jgi:hypothetical protein